MSTGWRDSSVIKGSQPAASFSPTMGEMFYTLPVSFLTPTSTIKFYNFTILQEEGMVVKNKDVPVTFVCL